MQQTGMLLELYSNNYALILESGKPKGQGGFQKYLA